MDTSINLWMGIEKYVLTQLEKNKRHSDICPKSTTGNIYLYIKLNKPSNKMKIPHNLTLLWHLKELIFKELSAEW